MNTKFRMLTGSCDHVATLFMQGKVGRKFRGKGDYRKYSETGCAVPGSFQEGFLKSLFI